MLWLLFLAVPVFVLCMGYFLLFMRWHASKTRGDRFFSLPVKQRKAFEDSLKKHTWILIPFLKMLAKTTYKNRLPYFRYKGIVCPDSIADAATFHKAENYSASAEDVFIATQMKCGTTWMQQIVFEILHHGEGDLTDQGYRHMYALSPWLETSPNASVSLEKAPLVSRYKKRIIKTHLPAQLCPFSTQAKYIYVTRNPVSCFASCQDFLAFLAGPFCPDTDDLVEWFCSDDMWWGSWPQHVTGWWDKSESTNNVFFITFEELKDNTRDSIQRLGKFLEVSLTAEEVGKIAEKASFQYMQEHEEQFEMSPPNLFSVSASELRFMQTGSKHRDKAMNASTQKRIMDFCLHELENSHFPFRETYKDIL